MTTNIQLTRATKTKEHSPTMSKRRDRRRDANTDLEASGTDESYTNAPGSHSSPNQIGARRVGEHGDGNSNSITSNQNGGGKSRLGSGGSSSKLKYKSGLGSWSQAVGEAARDMEAAQRAIKNLQEIFTLHMDDLDVMDETSRRLRQIEAECKEKNEELKRQEITITTLTSMDRKMRADIDTETKQLKKGQQELEQDKAKLERRVITATAEEKHKLNSEFEGRTVQYNESHDRRMKELEDEFAQKRADTDRRQTILEAEKNQLLTTVKDQQRTIESQSCNLEAVREQYDILNRAKNTYKTDKEAVEGELQMMKKEFALETQPTAHLYAS